MKNTHLTTISSGRSADTQVPHIVGDTGRVVLLLSIFALSAGDLMAQGTSPWLEAITVLQDAFTGPIARGLSLIAVVVGGLMFAFGEGGSKKALAGIIFGLGMAMGAANFLDWLF